MFAHELILDLWQEYCQREDLDYLLDLNNPDNEKGFRLWLAAIGVNAPENYIKQGEMIKYLREVIMMVNNRTFIKHYAVDRKNFGGIMTNKWLSLNDLTVKLSKNYDNSLISAILNKKLTIVKDKDKYCTFLG